MWKGKTNEGPSYLILSGIPWSARMSILQLEDHSKAKEAVLYQHIKFCMLALTLFPLNV